ncbi:MAG TPA: sugar ABC transporter substrate-binding protein [Chloroflexota bacterium]|nr:sugar ABC transporter substrate-binding protein [Chloroflexota bacterium]
MLRAGALAAVAGGLTACRQGGGAGTDGQEASKTRPPVALTTNIQSPASTQWPAYEAADKAIREKYPWLTMEYLGGSSSSYDAMAKMVVDAAAGSLPDMVYAQGTQIQYYISNAIVIPMTPYLNRDKTFDLGDFPKVAIDMYSRAGQVYAIPYDHGPNMLWYNADLFAKHGVAPPTEAWTWDDVVDAARRMTLPEQGQWGLVNGGPTAGWSMASYFGPWGAQWVDDTETKTGITTAPAIEAMQYWTDLFFKHKVNPVPGSFQGDPYLEGKAAMTIGGPWSYRGWIGRINFESPIADWPLGPGKRRVSASMGSGYPITVNSKHRDETWLYESELLGKDPDRSLLHQFVKTGLGTPVRFSVMKEYEKSKFAMPNVHLVAPAEKYSVLGRPISPIKVELDRVWTEERARLLTQEVSVKDMLDTVARRIQPFLDQNRGWDATK